MVQLKAPKTASKGIVMGKAYVVKSVDCTPSTLPCADLHVEIARYTQAVGAVTQKLEVLAKKNAIFAGHLELANDTALLTGVTGKVEEGQNAEQALANTTEEFAMIFEMMDDDYMRERAADIRDVSRRVMLAMKGLPDSDFTDITEQVILIAEDLAPSDTANLNLDLVLGFVTAQGGVTSHVSIMARNVGLPALVGVEEILQNVQHGDMIIMDASSGDVMVHPDAQTVAHYTQLQQAFAQKQAQLQQLAHLPAQTQDGKTVKIYANVGSVEDIKQAVEAHVHGVGLFRSEFLYMENTHFPTEEEQFAVYQQAAQLCSEEVIIRTLDIGGDKGLPYFDFAAEENPFLGWRAVRISLEMQDVFKAQLRALLRASAFGNIKIMYPMIISLEELLQANALLTQCKQELQAEGVAYNANIAVGMMIETPASVLQANLFAKHVDFFSIGTNDLTQYLLAVDRGNQKISQMYNTFHPAVLHAIQHVIDAGHAQGIEVGMCGEFACEERAAKMLLGMGLDEYSVSSTEAANIKSIVRGATHAECKQMAASVASCNTIDEVMQALA